MLLLLILAFHVQAGDRLDAILDRVSEEAEAFSTIAPKIIARETLRQTALITSRGFWPRIGSRALEKPPVKYKEREIVSEYGYGALKEVPGDLHELRKVISVDGRRVMKQKKARETLTFGITSDNDRLKKKMLREFESYGLTGAATDFGQIVLLFTRRQLENYEFQITGSGFIGDDRALILVFKQLQGDNSMTIFEGKRAVKVRLKGEVWVRMPDFVPVRITVSTTTNDGQQVVLHRGSADYLQSEFGAVLPTSVRYEKLVDDQLMVKNLYTYSSYHMFSANAEIKFVPSTDADGGAGYTPPATDR